MKVKIDILGEINRGNALTILSNIIAANNSSEVDEIILWIASPGGSKKAVTLLYEIIKMCNKPFYAVGALEVKNEAAAIFMMAEKRVLFPGTIFEISKIAKDTCKIGFCDGEKKDSFDSDSTEYWKYIVGNSGITIEALESRCNNIWKFADEELLGLGVVTSAYNREEVKSWIMES